MFKVKEGGSIISIQRCPAYLLGSEETPKEFFDGEQEIVTFQVSCNPDTVRDVRACVSMLVQAFGVVPTIKFLRAEWKIGLKEAKWFVDEAMGK